MAQSNVIRFDVWPLISPFVPILGVLVEVLAAATLRQWVRDRKRNAQLLKLGISDIDQMNGRTFERLVNAIFLKKGYKSEVTKYVGDWGADVIVSKDGVKTVIQAKRYSKAVGVRAVQEVLGAKGKYKAHRMLVITNRDYTRQAVPLAKANGVELWGRCNLLRELKSLGQ